ncbi:MAG: secondary thiamine-phosphate synthase enzyme YjbQ [Chloroflexi bacterium]|nr:secondary thiamine-phosphate synthase enzyme YjbQ [Chloroflexota bacterium]
MPLERAIDTDRKTQAVDVSAICQSMIAETRNGIAIFTLMHTTAALVVCEDEPNLRDDLVRVAEHWLADLRPFKHGRYGAPNAEAHITSALAGTSLTLPIVDGKLLLGSWQSILLLELDGPRRRKLVCTIIETKG